LEKWRCIGVERCIDCTTVQYACYDDLRYSSFDWWRGSRVVLLVTDQLDAGQQIKLLISIFLIPDLFLNLGCAEGALEGQSITKNKILKV
jgi:hypothetical protein